MFCCFFFTRGKRRRCGGVCVGGVLLAREKWQRWVREREVAERVDGVGCCEVLGSSGKEESLG